MASTWPPTKEAEFADWIANYSAKITLAPTLYGLVALDATNLATLVTGYNSAAAIVNDPTTKTAVAITNRDVAKAALLADIRSLARRIQATPTVTPGQKTGLGLPVHKTTPTVIPVPVTKPVLAIAGISKGRAVTIRIQDETTPTKNAKPFGVDGAEVYTYVPTASEAPPVDLTKWRFEGIAKRASFELNYDGEDVGKTAYVRALWFNPRGESGPASDDVTATIAA
jgi:hypothetical protein